MLLGPAMDTFEAQGECQAKKIDLDQQKEAHSSQWAMYFAPRSPEEIFVQTANRVLLWQSGGGSLSLDILGGFTSLRNSVREGGEVKNSSIHEGCVYFLWNNPKQMSVVNKLLSFAERSHKG